MIVLTSKINFGLDSLNTNVDGNCCMSIDCLNNVSFYDNKIIIENSAMYLMKFFIIGDLKGMFHLLGRNNFDLSYCLWCKCIPKEWKQHHVHHNTYGNKAKWDLREITYITLEQDKKKSSVITFEPIGIRLEQMLKHMPVQ